MGVYTNTSADTCADCDIGRWQTAAGAKTPCANCQAGSETHTGLEKYTMSGATLCTECAAGKYNLVLAEQADDPNYLTDVGVNQLPDRCDAVSCQACKMCDKGYQTEGDQGYQTEGYQTLDENGKKILTGAVKCQQCARGSYQTQVTAESGVRCRVCERGFEPQLSGEHAAVGADACEPCVKGKYQAESGTGEACAICGQGHQTQDAMGFENEFASPPRRYVNKGAVACELCVPGMHRARSLCRFVPPTRPLYTTITNIFGNSISEATMRPNPRYAPRPAPRAHRSSKRAVQDMPVGLGDTQRLGSEKDAELAQKLGHLQPFIAVSPHECLGQLASSGPT